MKNLWGCSRFELAVIAFCGWQAADLLTTWRHSPFDRWGWLGFAIWLAPVGVSLVRRLPRTDASLPWSGMALALAVFGRLLDFNALLCVALAVALAAKVPSSPHKWFWLAGALAWMPLLGWVAHDLPIAVVASIRLLFATTASAALLIPRPADEIA